jgi:phytanoyl-CoA hydroxylase
MQDHNALKESYQRDGFLHIPQFINAQELDEIEIHVNHIIQQVVPQMPKQDAMYEDYDRRESLKQVNVPLADTPLPLVELRQSEKVQGLATALLGDQAVPQSIELFIKPPKLGTPTPPHQDGFYFCLEPDLALTLWLALDDMDDENGTLHYIAGSHTHGILSHSASQVLGFSQGVQAGDLTPFGREVTCYLRRGDLLIHNSSTIHRASGNPSNRLRRALAMVYYGKSTQRDMEKYRRYQESVQNQQESMGVR